MGNERMAPVPIIIKIFMHNQIQVGQKATANSPLPPSDHSSGLGNARFHSSGLQPHLAQ